MFDWSCSVNAAVEQGADNYCEYISFFMVASISAVLHRYAAVGFDVVLDKFDVSVC